jgi:hypothetical protein
MLAGLFAVGAATTSAGVPDCHNQVGPILESTSIEVKPSAVRVDGRGIWLRFILYGYGRGTGEPWTGSLTVSLDGRDILSVSSHADHAAPSTIHLYYVSPGRHEIGLRMSNPWNGYIGFTTCVTVPGSYVIRRWRSW